MLHQPLPLHLDNEDQVVRHQVVFETENENEWVGVSVSDSRVEHVPAIGVNRKGNIVEYDLPGRAEPPPARQQVRPTRLVCVCSTLSRDIQITDSSSNSFSHKHALIVSSLILLLLPSPPSFHSPLLSRSSQPPPFPFPSPRGPFTLFALLVLPAICHCPCARRPLSVPSVSPSPGQPSSPSLFRNPGSRLARHARRGRAGAKHLRAAMVLLVALARACLQPLR